MITALRDFIDLADEASPILPYLYVLTDAIAIYFALATGVEKMALPGRNLITADETTEFKQSD